jgi:RNA recognition motif-containing protein
MPYSNNRSSRSSRSRSSSRNDRSRRSTPRYGNSNRPERERNKPEPKSSFWSKLLGFLGIKKSTSSHRSSSGSSPRSSQVNSASSTQGIRTEPEPLNPETITTQRLYVGNLSYDTSESDLYDAFTRYGVVKNVEIIMDRRTQRSKGFGFVEMETLAAARKAAVALHRLDFMGRTIVVSSAKADPALNPIDAAHEKSNSYSPSSLNPPAPTPPDATGTTSSVVSSDLGSTSEDSGSSSSQEEQGRLL